MSSSARIDAAAKHSELVREALALAGEAHAGQIRNGSGGMPYLDHPLAVAELLEEFGYGEMVLASALLHDVVEESETGVEEIRADFGEQVGDLVAALTDEEKIQPYGRRKDVHRAQVAAAGPEALAIYGADKLANIRALRRVYASEGEAVGEQLKAPLDVKVAVWEADVLLLQRATPELGFLTELEAQLEGLRAERQLTLGASAP
jgi:(p)ppGpp synthase/HD superfamily hydrolase